jgi:1,4-alpha-glucan branching enzyme
MMENKMLTKRFFKTKDEVEVTFEFSREGLNTVALAGEFNDWQPMSMKLNKKEKAFRTKIRLPKGEEFKFKYLLNEDEWENDYQADKYIANSLGTEDSVVSTVTD